MNSLNQIKVNVNGVLDAFLDTGYVESPEWYRVITDNQDRILGGIKPDGSVEWALGVPTPVKDYLNTEITKILNGTESTSIDGLNKIITFLEDFSTSDTLANLLSNKADASLLNTKVDKEEGKSLINKEFADGVNYIDNSEYSAAWVDNDDKILEAIRVDGTKVIYGDVEVLGTMNVAGVTYNVISSEEYLAAWVDSALNVIFGFKSNGKTYVGDADFLEEIRRIRQFLPADLNTSIDWESLDWEALESLKEVEQEEFVSIEIDAADNMLSSRDSQGVKREYVGFEAPTISTGGHEVSNFNDPEGRIEMKTDLSEKVISYRDIKGVLHEVAGLESPEVSTNSLQLTKQGMKDFQNALKDSGFTPGGKGDWSDYISNDGENPLQIPEPRCAIVNFTNEDGNLTWPTSKTADKEAYIEFYDMQGNYFKKKAIFNAQGNSSMQFPKKNGAIDLFDSDWDEDAFKVRFGDWVPQDSFHLKCYYTDFFKGLAVCGYNLYDDIVNVRGVHNNRTYKRYFTDSFNVDGSANGNENEPSEFRRICETGAYCHPKGFPCIVYLNGVFYGIYSWQLKKHRDNMWQIKDNSKHIHLDGEISTQTIWREEIDWDVIAGKKSTLPSGWRDGIEIRNPKDLVYAEAHDGVWKYDADSPGQYKIAGNDDGSHNYDTWEARSYPVNKIVEHNGHLFINTLEGNENEPIYNKKTNGDNAPDFKNKTGCKWLNVTGTVEVKEYFLRFSKYLLELKALDDNPETTEEEMKAAIEARFDVDSLIDYIVFNNVIANHDGWAKNWQWTTWDGVKWSVNPYDLDILCGSMWLGTVINAAGNEKYGNHRETLSDQTTTDYPSYYVWKYYGDILQTKYDALREAKIISVEAFMAKVEDWMGRVGYENYKKEYELWDEAPCNRRNGTYTLTPTTGGHFDSVYRLWNWLVRRISFMDSWTW